MIHSLTITNDETEQCYHIIEKDGRIWLENQDDEGMGITETQLFEIIDEYFKASH